MQLRKQTYSNYLKLKRNLNSFIIEKCQPGIDWRNGLKQELINFTDFIFLHLPGFISLTLSWNGFSFMVIRSLQLLQKLHLFMWSAEKKKQVFTRISLTTGCQWIWLCHISIPKLNTEFRGWISLIGLALAIFFGLKSGA